MDMTSISPKEPVHYLEMTLRNVDTAALVDVLKDHGAKFLIDARIEDREGLC